jgi:uncharacterized membrane protein
MFITILSLLLQTSLLFSAVQQSFIAYHKIKSSEDLEKVKDYAVIPGLMWGLFYLSVLVAPIVLTKFATVVNS